MSQVVVAETEVMVHRPAGDVMSYFADFRNEPTWNKGHVHTVSKVTPGPVGLGTRFEGEHPGMGHATWILTGYEPGRNVRVEGAVGGAPYAFEGTFTPAEGGTRMRGRVEWSPRGAWRALGPLLGPVLRWRARRSFANLRSALEREAHRP